MEHGTCQWVPDVQPDLVLESFVTMVGHGFSLHRRPAPCRMRCSVCGRRI
jgi:hypothetical protein